MQTEQATTYLKEISIFLENYRMLDEIAEYGKDLNVHPLHLFPLDNPAKVFRDPYKCDEGTQLMVPLEFVGRVAVDSTGNGSCLFNSVSLIFFQNELQAVQLRLAAVLELMLHPQFYLDQKIFEEDYLYSDAALNAADLKDEGAGLDSYNKASVYIEEIHHTLKPTSWVPFVVVAGLASAIHRPIYSVYMATMAIKITEMYTKVILPSEQWYNEPIYLMWCYDKIKTSSQANDYFENIFPHTNHFVPLLLLSEEDNADFEDMISYQNITQDFEFEKKPSELQAIKSNLKSSTVSEDISTCFSNFLQGKNIIKDKDPEKLVCFLNIASHRFHVSAALPHHDFDSNAVDFHLRGTF